MEKHGQQNLENQHLDFVRYSLMTFGSYNFVCFIESL